MRNFCLLLFLSLVLFSSGCMTMGSGIAPSTKPITGRDSYTELGHASGSAWGFYLLGILPLSEPSPAVAIRRACKSSGGDMLVDVMMSNQIFMIPLLGNIFRTKVEGTAAKLKRGD